MPKRTKGKCPKEQRDGGHTKGWILIDDCCSFASVPQTHFPPKEREKRGKIQKIQKTKHLSEKRHSSSKSLSAKRQ